MIYTSNYDTVLKYPELADRLVSIAQHTHRRSSVRVKSVWLLRCVL